ncbi:TetR family transcriptional regulator [Marinicella pacifica]|jgi:AcrR family transcriptional regulator|uniref:TetR family transcriptional regulator n=1 Tax=Marinicella pacifica TaxID=1171543 RepID=A0A917FMQ5_9GAMM|nr:TetR/AcrR family transcriptional regulator [Marinicella pacifica]GGF91912.1 TetR family transcriptional regulator [Marinicella pacifica]
MMKQNKAISESTKKKSLNPKDWEQATLEVIAHQGVSAVAVETIARVLGVTKGSFYWHFTNRKDLIIAALKRWRNEDNKVIKQRVLSVNDPYKRLKTWFLLSSEPYQSHLIYATLLADRQHSYVSKVLKEVTVERLSYLQQCYQDIGYTETKAKQQALLAYSVYVGYLHMTKTLHGQFKHDDNIEAYVKHVAGQLIHPPEAISIDLSPQNL